MDKTIFNNQIFYALILALLLVLLSWNLYTFFVSNNWVALIPAIVQAIVLILVLFKNKHAKLGIKIWAIILIIGPTLSILGKGTKILLGDPLNEVSPLILQLVILLTGLGIYHYNSSTVEVKKLD